jgi:hypothetical protein
MKEELNADSQHQVFEDFVELPEGRKALPSHWVYKIKRGGAGNVQQFKVRLVCGGYHQIKGIDYQATYAPTARLGHVCLALAIAANYDLEIHRMDVCMAFLGIDLEEEIYISKMYFSHWKPPGVSERMWSVNLDASISGEYQTLGGHCCRPSELLGAPTTSLGAPGSAGDMSGSTSNHSRAVWEKQHLLWEHCWCAWKS